MTHAAAPDTHTPTHTHTPHTHTHTHPHPFPPLPWPGLRRSPATAATLHLSFAALALRWTAPLRRGGQVYPSTRVARVYRAAALRDAGFLPGLPGLPPDGAKKKKKKGVGKSRTPPSRDEEPPALPPPPTPRRGFAPLPGDPAPPGRRAGKQGPRGPLPPVEGRAPLLARARVPPHAAHKQAGGTPARAGPAPAPRPRRRRRGGGAARREEGGEGRPAREPRPPASPSRGCPRDKSLCRGLILNRSQRGSCSATYETLTQNQVVYE